MYLQSLLTSIKDLNHWRDSDTYRHYHQTEKKNAILAYNEVTQCFLFVFCCG